MKHDTLFIVGFIFFVASGICAWIAILTNIIGFSGIAGLFNLLSMMSFASAYLRLYFND